MPRDSRSSSMVAVRYAPAADPAFVPAVSRSDTLRLAQIPGLPKPGTASSLAPGLYVHVIDGLINLSNKGGAQSFTAGQFGFVPSPTKPPVVVPKNPGIVFMPPPTFIPSSGNPGASGAPKSNAVDCEVR
jgi:hypothetical protein